MRIVLLAFKESPVNGSPFGLSLFVPLWSPPARWDVQKNLLLVHLHVKPSPCCRPLCLSGTSMIVDLSMGQSCNFPMHISKARGGQFCLISLYRFFFKAASKITTSTRPHSQTSKAFILVSCDGVNNYDPWAALQAAVGRLTWTLRSPNLYQFVRIVLLAFKESPVNGSPFGLSLFVPLWSPPGRWDVQKNLLLVHLHVKLSPCCRPLCLSGTSMIVDLSMCQSCNFPMHISKTRGGQFWLIAFIEMVKTASKITTSTRPQPQISKAFILVSCDGVNKYDPWAALQTAVGRLTWTLRSPNL